MIQAIKDVLNFCCRVRARVQVANAGGLSLRHRLLRAGMAVCAISGLVACGEAKNPNEYPVGAQRVQVAFGGAESELLVVKSKGIQKYFGLHAEARGTSVCAL